MNFFRKKTEEEKLLKKLEKEVKELKKSKKSASTLEKRKIKKIIKQKEKNIQKIKMHLGIIPFKSVSPKYIYDENKFNKFLNKNFIIEIGKLAYQDLSPQSKKEFDTQLERYTIGHRLLSKAKQEAMDPNDDEEVQKEIALQLKNTSMKDLIKRERFKYDVIKPYAEERLKDLENDYLDDLNKKGSIKFAEKARQESLLDDSDFLEWLSQNHRKYYKVFTNLHNKSNQELIPKGEKLKYPTMDAGKKRSKKSKKSKSKKIRKHTGINQQTGRLKKGYKYSGKKLKSGLPQIVKIKK